MPAAVESPVVSHLPLDDPEMREIVDEFVERLAQQLAALEKAYREDNLRQVAEIAHWIKGTAGNVGFDAFTRPAGALENRARGGIVGELGELIDQLKNLSQRIQLPVA
jgi:HPt (histidine-containing phosphotransfer) domain-containing protein